MKEKLTTLIVVCLVVACAGLWPAITEAQHRPEIDVQEWPKGKVVLTDGDTLYGALTYYRTEDVVNVHHEDGTMTSVTPVNVEYFIAQELPSGRSHTFRTLYWNMGKPYSDFKKPTFFEELNRGTLSLMMREAYVRRDGPNATGLGNLYYDPKHYDANKFADQVKEQYYILLPSGEVLGLRNLRKDLHALFGNKSKEVKSYVKVNKLEYEKPHELIAIINYFNVISNTTSAVY